MPARSVRVIIAVLIAVVAASCSALSDRVDLATPGVTGRWIDVVGAGSGLDAGLVRRALVAAPDDIDPRQQRFLGGDSADPGGGLPLVVVNHGLGSTPEFTAAVTGWPSVVGTDRMLAVFPEGWEASFNAGGCCGEAVAAGVDDVAFLRDVIDAVSGLYPVDRDRVFMTGYSNGGMVTYRFLCEHANLLAGAGSVVGTNADGCAPSAPVSFLQITGRDDTVVPPAGGTSSTPGLGPFASTVESAELVARAGRCGERDTVELGVAEVTRWPDCEAGVRVELDLVPFGHDWPMAPEYAATARLLQFWGLRPTG
jgi:polyhydroxybutyrate depolymerase